MEEVEAGPGPPEAPQDGPNDCKIEKTQQNVGPQNVGSVPQGPEISPLQNLEDHAAASLPPLPAEIPSFAEEDQTLVVTAAASQDASSEDRDDSIKEDRDGNEALLPPGPIDPENCSVSGPGFSGASAGAPVTLVLVSKDSIGRRIKEGGAYVLVFVESTGPGAAADDDGDPLEAEVVDNKDGTYSATYAVPSKGSYALSIEVNGEPIGGSPFPVFFSAAGRDANTTTTGGGGAGDASIQGANALQGPDGSGATTIAAPPAMLTAEASAIAAAASMSSMPNLSTIGLQFSLGPQAAQLGVVFPQVEDSQLARTSLVGGVSPFATQEALRTVFALSCRVRSVEFADPARTFAFIEFETRSDADTSLRLTGVTFMGQALRVENALNAREAAAQVIGAVGAAAGGAGSSCHPFFAMQAQQVQAYQMMQVQQATLAQQVAHLRASGGGGGGLGGKGRRNVDDYAAAAMARKFGAPSQHHHSDSLTRDDTRDRNGGSRRRERSRTRSRSCDRRRRSRSRSTSRERRHRGEKKRHHHKSKRSSRSRSRSHGRKVERKERRRSRSRSKGEKKHRYRSRSKDRRHGDEKNTRGYRGGAREENRRELSERTVVDKHREEYKVVKVVVRPPASPVDDLEALLDELDG